MKRGGGKYPVTPFWDGSDTVAEVVENRMIALAQMALTNDRSEPVLAVAPVMQGDEGFIETFRSADTEPVIAAPEALEPQIAQPLVLLAPVGIAVAAPAQRAAHPDLPELPTDAAAFAPVISAPGGTQAGTASGFARYEFPASMFQNATEQHETVPQATDARALPETVAGAPRPEPDQDPHHQASKDRTTPPWWPDLPHPDRPDRSSDFRQHLSRQIADRLHPADGATEESLPLATGRGTGTPTMAPDQQGPNNVPRTPNGAEVQQAVSAVSGAAAPPPITMPPIHQKNSLAARDKTTSPPTGQRATPELAVAVMAGPSVPPPPVGRAEPNAPVLESAAPAQAGAGASTHDRWPSPAAPGGPTAAAARPERPAPGAESGIWPLADPAILTPGDAPAISLAMDSTARPPPTVLTPAPPLPAGAAPMAPPIHHQIARAMEARPDGPIEVTLAPEELGRVRMTMTTSDQGLTLHLTAERPETVELLRRHIGELAQEFRDLGFRTLAFSFGQGDGSAGQRPPENPSEAAEYDMAAIAPPPPDAPPPRLRMTPGDGLDLRF